MYKFEVKGIVRNVSFGNDYSDVSAECVFFVCARVCPVAHFFGGAPYFASQLCADAAFAGKSFGNSNDAYPKFFSNITHCHIFAHIILPEVFYGK